MDIATFGRAKRQTNTQKSRSVPVATEKYRQKKKKKIEGCGWIMHELINDC